MHGLLTWLEGNHEWNPLLLYEDKQKKIPLRRIYALGGDEPSTRIQEILEPLDSFLERVGYRNISLGDRLFHFISDREFASRYLSLLEELEVITPFEGDSTEKVIQWLDGRVRRIDEIRESDASFRGSLRENLPGKSDQIDVLLGLPEEEDSVAYLDLVLANAPTWMRVDVFAEFLGRNRVYCENPENKDGIKKCKSAVKGVIAPKHTTEDGLCFGLACILIHPRAKTAIYPSQGMLPTAYKTKYAERASLIDFKLAHVILSSPEVSRERINIAVGDTAVVSRDRVGVRTIQGKRKVHRQMTDLLSEASSAVQKDWDFIVEKRQRIVSHKRNKIETKVYEIMLKRLTRIIENLCGLFNRSSWMYQPDIANALAERGFVRYLLKKEKEAARDLLVACQIWENLSYLEDGRDPIRKCVIDDAELSKTSPQYIYFVVFLSRVYFNVGFRSFLSGEEDFQKISGYLYSAKNSCSKGVNLYLDDKDTHGDYQTKVAEVHYLLAKYCLAIVLLNIKHREDYHLIEELLLEANNSIEIACSRYTNASDLISQKYSKELEILILKFLHQFALGLKLEEREEDLQDPGLVLEKIQLAEEQYKAVAKRIKKEEKKQKNQSLVVQRAQSFTTIPTTPLQNSHLPILQAWERSNIKHGFAPGTLKKDRTAHRNFTAFASSFLGTTITREQREELSPVEEVEIETEAVEEEKRDASDEHRNDRESFEKIVLDQDLTLSDLSSHEFLTKEFRLVQADFVRVARFTRDNADKWTSSDEKKRSEIFNKAKDHHLNFETAQWLLKFFACRNKVTYLNFALRFTMPIFSISAWQEVIDKAAPLAKAYLEEQLEILNAKEEDAENIMDHILPRAMGNENVLKDLVEEINQLQEGQKKLQEGQKKLQEVQKKLEDKVDGVPTDIFDENSKVEFKPEQIRFYNAFAEKLGSILGASFLLSSKMIGMRGDAIGTGLSFIKLGDTAVSLVTMAASGVKLPIFLFGIVQKVLKIVYNEKIRNTKFYGENYSLQTIGSFQYALGVHLCLRYKNFLRDGIHDEDIEKFGRNCAWKVLPLLKKRKPKDTWLNEIAINFHKDLKAMSQIQTALAVGVRYSTKSLWKFDKLRLKKGRGRSFKYCYRGLPLIIWGENGSGRIFTNSDEVGRGRHPKSQIIKKRGLYNYLELRNHVELEKAVSYEYIKDLGLEKEEQVVTGRQNSQEFNLRRRKAWKEPVTPAEIRKMMIEFKPDEWEIVVTPGDKSCGIHALFGNYQNGRVKVDDPRAKREELVELLRSKKEEIMQPRENGSEPSLFESAISDLVIDKIEPMARDCARAIRSLKRDGKASDLDSAVKEICKDEGTWEDYLELLRDLEYELSANDLRIASHVFGVAVVIFTEEAVLCKNEPDSLNNGLRVIKHTGSSTLDWHYNMCIKKE